MNVIETFRTPGGGHLFLSNFYESPITIPPNRYSFAREEFTYPTVEHFYQAAKAPTWKEHNAIASCGTPNQAKKLGRSVEMRKFFEAEKLAVMRYALRYKFPLAECRLSRMLVDTGDSILLEGNTWGDSYWGVVNGKGQNWLGHLLMARRAEVAGHIGTTSQLVLY